MSPVCMRCLDCRSELAAPDPDRLVLVPLSERLAQWLLHALQHPGAVATDPGVAGQLLQSLSDVFQPDG